MAPMGSEQRADLWRAVAIPAVAMSLGWGLRGQYGGPRGAMVPGALVALALLLTSRRRYPAAQVWLIAAAGALGFAIGGEETYMQTVALAHNPETALHGYLGILLKGAEWGGLGGLFLGLALGGSRRRLSELLVAVNAAWLLSFPAYWLVNAPKLIYFSGGGTGRPRPEGWAGIWALYLVLLACAAWGRERVAVRMSLWGCAGCGLGFTLGVAAYAWGDSHLGASTGGFMDWWKVAECGFGLIGGAVLGYGWWSTQQTVAGADAGAQPEDAAARTEEAVGALPPAAVMSLLALDTLLFLQIADSMDDLPGWIGKAPFAFLAPALMLIAIRSPALALTLGVVTPISVTLLNVQQYWFTEQHIVGGPISIASIVLLTALAAWCAARQAANPRKLFLLTAWSTVALAWLKMGIPAPGSWAVYFVVQGIFTLMAVFLTVETRVRPETANTVFAAAASGGF